MEERIKWFFSSKVRTLLTMPTHPNLKTRVLNRFQYQRMKCWELFEGLPVLHLNGYKFMENCFSYRFSVNCLSYFWSVRQTIVTTDDRNECPIV